MIDLANETILTLSEASRRLRVAHSTLRAWIAGGKLDGVTLPGGRMRTSVEALGRMCGQSPAQKPETVAREKRRAERVAQQLREMGV